MILLSLLFSLHAAAAPKLSCTATYRTLDKNQQSVVKTISMEVVAPAPGYTRHEASLEGKYLSVLEEPGSDDALTQITHEPDYTRGSVTRSAPDSRGMISLSEVVGATVHRIECLRK